MFSPSSFIKISDILKSLTKYYNPKRKKLNIQQIEDFYYGSDIMVKVTKRDRRSEDFVYEKIVVSCVKAGAPVETARDIAKIVEGKIHDNIPTKDIKKLVLEALREKNPEWEKNWLIYDKAVKKRIE